MLALTPGPALFYILATSIAQGTRAGVISVLGIATGTLVHIVLAVFGLTLLLASSAAVFQFVKFSGAVYLAALGLYLLTRPRQEKGAQLERSTRDLWNSANRDCSGDGYPVYIRCVWRDAPS